MEGYFWRITDADRGRSLIALIGVNRDRVGGHWCRDAAKISQTRFV
jgi:hypothetical protein